MPVVPLRFRPGLLALVCLAAGCGTAAKSSHRAASADLVVRDFCDRFGRRSGQGLLSLFADSGRFDIEGVGVSFVGREGLGRLADYGVAAHSRLRPRDFESRQDTIRCRFDESNNWLGLLGVGRASYRGWFRVSGTRILEARVRLTPESSDELGGRLAGFVVWLRKEDPKALERLFPGGRPAYDAAVVRELIVRLRQWRSRSR